MDLQAQTERQSSNKHLTTTQAICRMAEADLVRNIDESREYFGFKGLYCEGMVEKKHISNYGHVYDITKKKDSRHILEFLKYLLSENIEYVVMTSGSFFSMNKSLQRAVVKGLVELSKKVPVTLFVGEKTVPNLFKKYPKIEVTVFNRKTMFIPHFIKTDKHFNFVLPHTEAKLIRVDLSSHTFEPEAAKRINTYFDKLLSELDQKIKKGNGTDNNVISSNKTSF